MDPPPSQPLTAAAAAATATTTKLRLMCSYGGQILPRPDTNALFYCGGDTRIISLPTSPTSSHLSLSSLTRHVSDSLHVSTPFTLKYQLPNHTLDYLISVSSDEDVTAMLDEHHIFSPAASRIRLFLFHLRSSGLGSGKLAYPKRESWFVDALKSVKIGGDDGHSAGGGGVGGGRAESMLLETSSSFGSSSSSASSSSSGVKGGCGQVVVVEDNGGVGNLLDVKVNVSSSEFVPSENKNVASMTAPSLVTTYVDNPVDAAATPENSNLSDFQAKILSPPTTGVEVRQANIGCSSYASVLPCYYTTHNVVGAVPTSPYYGPVYVVPLEQPCNPQPLHQVAYKNPASQVYRPTVMASPILNTNVLQNETNHQPADFSQINHHAQPNGALPLEATHYEYGLDDDPALAQIYKSQPPPPGSQYQSMTKATAVFASRFAIPKHDQGRSSPALEGLEATPCGQF